MDNLEQIIKPQNNGGARRSPTPDVNLFGINVRAATMGAALDEIDDVIQSRGSLQIGVVNAAKIVNMRRNSKLRDAVLASDAIYADGMSVVWASRILRRSLPERIAGIDLMHGILERGSVRSYRIFCLGATQEVVNSVTRKFKEEYPNVTIAGSRDGYFSEDDEAEVAAQIRDAKADVLFVAITSPKKEKFMARWADTMGVSVVHGVGGSFDVVAGIVKRAPESWQNSGFEWLYRVIQEPRRLVKRYVVTNTIFTWMLLCEALGFRSIEI